MVLNESECCSIRSVHIDRHLSSSYMFIKLKPESFIFRSTDISQLWLKATFWRVIPCPNSYHPNYITNKNFKIFSYFQLWQGCYRFKMINCMFITLWEKLCCLNLLLFSGQQRNWSRNFNFLHNFSICNAMWRNKFWCKVNRHHTMHILFPVKTKKSQYIWIKLT